jgi:hypothetical protein
MSSFVILIGSVNVDIKAKIILSLLERGTDKPLGPVIDFLHNNLPLSVILKSIDTLFVGNSSILHTDFQPLTLFHKFSIPIFSISSFSFVNSSQPVLVEPEGKEQYKYVIMPVRA